jgi:hypothetical protein
VLNGKGFREQMKVIPIRPKTGVSDRHDEVADQAFDYWLARFGVSYGSPEDDLARAERELTGWIPKPQRTTAGLFVVPRSRSSEE